MNIARKAFETYQKYLANKLAASFSFTIFVLGSLAIGLLGSYLFIILIPIVVLPLFICLQLVNSAFAKGMPLTQKNFFGFYRSAFTPTMSGSYQVLSSFLKAALLYFGLSFAVVFIMTQVLITRDASFASEIDSMAALIANGGLQEAIAAYESNPNIIYISTISTLISGGLGLLAFLHLIGRNAIVPHLAISMAALPGRIAYSVHRQGLKIFKHGFNVDYYKSVWFGAPLILIGFAGGVLATYFFTSDLYLILLSGFAGAFLVLTPFLPYFFDVIEEIFKKYKDRYLQVSIDQAKKVYDEIKIASDMNEEQRQEIDRLINDLKKKSDVQDDKDEDENPSDE